MALLQWVGTICIRPCVDRSQSPNQNASALSSSSCTHILSLYLYSYQLSRYNDAMTCCRDTAVQIACDRFPVTVKFRRSHSSRENHARRHRRLNSFPLSLDCRRHVICRGKTRVSAWLGRTARNTIGLAPQPRSSLCRCLFMFTYIIRIHTLRRYAMCYGWNLDCA